MCFNCGGSHSSRRGGEAFSGNSYSTWMNNCGNLFDNPTRADASWLSNGDYDRAFKGYPSHKTINIFMNTGYQTQSWGSTLLGGFIGLGIQGLGLWALSGLFGRKKAQAQPQYSAGVGTGFWTNYFSNLKMPSWSLGSTPVQTTATTTATTTTTTTTTTQSPENTSPVTTTPVENNNNTTTKFPQAEFTNKKLKNNQPIKGDVKNIKYDDTKSGYPTSFEIHDTTLNTNKVKDSDGNILANIYHFQLTNDAEINTNTNTKPIYKCVKAELYLNQQGVQYYDNDFTINSGFSTDKDSDGHYTIPSELKAEDYTDKSTVGNMKNIDFKNGKKRTKESSRQQ